MQCRRGETGSGFPDRFRLFVVGLAEDGTGMVKIQGPARYRPRFASGFTQPLFILT